jgi:thiol-disulfide isomerase/thioredoxin
MKINNVKGSNKMIKIFASILVLFFAVAVTGCQKESHARTKPAVKNTVHVQKDGKKAPDFTLLNVAGEKVSLSDYKGKVVILDFWATWCGPCRRGIPDLISIQNDYKDDVVVIGISLDRDNTIARVPSFVKSMKINYPIVYFNDKVINDFGGVSAIPTTFIIDQKGNIVHKMIGLYPRSEYEKTLKNLIEGS